MGDAAENAGGDAGDAGNRIRLFIEMLCCKMESCNRKTLQSGWSVCRTGNGEKLSNSQVRCLAQLYLATA